MLNLNVHVLTQLTDCDAVLPASHGATVGPRVCFGVGDRGADGVQVKPARAVAEARGEPAGEHYGPNRVITMKTSFLHFSVGDVVMMMRVLELGQG